MQKREKSYNRNYILLLIKLIVAALLLVWAGKAVFFEPVTFNQEKALENVICGLLLTGILFVSVFRVETFWEMYRSHEKAEGIGLALFLSVSFARFFNPMDSDRTALTQFKRVIGPGVSSGYDISRVVQNFTIWFLTFGLSFGLFLLFVNGVRKVKEEQEIKRVWRFLDEFSALALVVMALCMITFFSDCQAADKTFHYSLLTAQFVIFIGLGYILFRINRKIRASDFYDGLFLLFVVSCPAAVILSGIWSSGCFLHIIRVVFAGLMIFGLFFLIEKWQKDLAAFLAGLSFLPLLTSLYIELVHVLNQYGVFVADPRTGYILAVLLLLVLTVVFAVILARKNLTVQWKSLAYPTVIAGVSMLSRQVPFSQEYDIHIFESANFSILISDFLQFGSIPVAEHYGGHMMTDVWEGIIYGLVNQDYEGAVVSPYGQYLAVPVLAVLFYFFVKEIWNQDMAFWTVLLFPFYGSWYYFGYGMLVCLGVLAFIRKSTYLRAFLLWFACAWCALYRLDVGYAFIVAAVVALVAYIVTEKDRKPLIKRLFLSLTGVVVFFLVLWFAISVVKGYHPLKRLQEFLLISFSNQNWAFDGIGDPAKTAYAWNYAVLPFLVEACILYTILSKEFREKITMSKWLLLLMFGTSYFVNFSRGLVRHSVVEMDLRVTVWCAYFFLAMFFACLKERGKLMLPVLLAFLVFNLLLLQDTNFAEEPLADQAVSKMWTHVDSWTEKITVQDSETGESSKTYWQNLKDKQQIVQRVEFNADQKRKFQDYQSVLDHLLEEEDTFLDFVNQTFLYSALNRRAPMYISQSPMQLSGEFTQEMFRDEIDENLAHVPLALLPNKCSAEGARISLDNISNAYKYYIVSEYIYQNYRPLCNMGDLAVWCTSGRYGEMKEKLQGLDQAEEIEAGYDGADLVTNEDGEEQIVYFEQLHNYNLQKLAQEWAEMDQDRAVDNPVVAEVEPGEGCFRICDADQIDKSQGNYLHICVKYTRAAAEENADSVLVRMGVDQGDTFVEKYRYTFTPEEGRHDYLIRISSDYFWYTEAINAFTLTSDGSWNILQMEILEGGR